MSLKPGQLHVLNAPILRSGDLSGPSLPEMMSHRGLDEPGSLAKSMECASLKPFMAFLLPCHSHEAKVEGENSRLSSAPAGCSYLFKYIIIGDSGVGKSCLLLQVGLGYLAPGSSYLFACLSSDTFTLLGPLPRPPRLPQFTDKRRVVSPAFSCRVPGDSCPRS